MKFTTRIAVAALCIGACVHQRWRDEAPELATKMAVVFPSVECWRLGNGTRVCALEIPGSPVVAVGLSLRIDGQPDPPGFAGATAAMLGALVSARDTDGHRALKRGLGDLGAQANIEDTAQGVLIWTHAQPAVAGRALAVIAASVTAPVLTQDLLKDVRANQCERAQAVTGDPDTLANLGLLRRLLPDGHPVAMPALRTQICHETLTLAQAVGLQQTYVGPDNVALLVAGDVSPDEVDTWSRAALGDWTRRTTLAPPPPPITHGSGGVTIVDVPGLAQTVIAFGGFAGAGERADAPALQVAAAFLQGALHVALREEMGATYGVGVSLVPVGERALWQIQTRVETGQTGRVLRRLRGELRDLNRWARPSDASIFTVRINHLTAAMASMHTASGALQGAAQMHWYSRPVDYYGQMPARVGDVDGEAVVRVLQGSFVAAGAELVLVGDAAALVRQSPDLRDAAVLLPIQVTDGL